VQQRKLTRFEVLDWLVLEKAEVMSMGRMRI